MPAFTARRGMSLVELLITLVIFSVVLTAALGTLQSQSRAFTAGNDRMDVLQNLRYALNTLEKDLRTTGSGVPAEQPFLVYAGTDVVVFNADYATNKEFDYFAVYSDTSAPDAIVSALTATAPVTIPTTLQTYPDTTYWVSGTNSPAESIIFFFEEDETTPREDDYVLYRQINNADPEIVARNLLRSGDSPFFEYHRLVTPEGQPTTVGRVPRSALPLFHEEPIHNSPADTGRLAIIDSVRVVQVNLASTNGLTGDRERIVSASRQIRLPNAGLTALQTCGDEPLLNSPLHARPVEVESNGSWAVELEWNRATDEAGGERDVLRYVIWRRTPLDLDWGDAYLSIAAGQTSYSFEDTRVESGQSYRYALAAQDCTPSLSALTTSDWVTVP